MAELGCNKIYYNVLLIGGHIRKTIFSTKCFKTPNNCSVFGAKDSAKYLVANSAYFLYSSKSPGVNSEVTF